LKIKNKSTRNVSVLGQHSAQGGEPYRMTVMAGAILTLADEDYAKVTANVLKLVDAGVLEITEAPETKLTNAEIVAKVEAEAEVKLSVKSTKAKLQAQAAKLGVSL